MQWRMCLREHLLALMDLQERLLEVKLMILQDDSVRAYQGSLWAGALRIRLQLPQNGWLVLFQDDHGGIQRAIK